MLVGLSDPVKVVKLTNLTCPTKVTDTSSFFNIGQGERLWDCLLKIDFKFSCDAHMFNLRVKLLSQY